MITRFDGTTKVADVSTTVDDILNAIYPIGVIVCGAKPTVGTWEKVEGKFLLGSSSSHKAGSTGGEEKHKLTINEMPAHKHNGHFINLNANGAFDYAGGGKYAADSPTSSTGGGQAHNNMPPYLSVDMWRRTA